MVFRQMHKLWQALGGALLLWGLSSLPVQAIVLDWATATSNGANTPDLPANAAGGVVSTTYTNVGGSGIDVTISFQAFTPGGSSISVDTTSDYVNRTTPISGDTHGGAIEISYDASDDQPYVRVTIAFSQAVENFQMEVWDLDRNSWRDEVRNITRVAPGGGTFNPASVTAASTNTEGITTTANSARANNNAGNPSTSDGGADVLIDFGTGAANSVFFDYGNYTFGVDDPATQLIWISGFSFDAVIPEPSTYAAGILLLLTLGVTEWARRRRRSDVSA